MFSHDVMSRGYYIKVTEVIFIPFRPDLLPLSAFKRKVPSELLKGEKTVISF